MVFYYIDFDLNWFFLGDYLIRFSIMYIKDCNIVVLFVKYFIVCWCFNFLKYIFKFFIFNKEMFILV